MRHVISTRLAEHEHERDAALERLVELALHLGVLVRDVPVEVMWHIRIASSLNHYK